MQRATTNMSKGQHLEQTAYQNLFDDCLRRERAERVEDGLRPGRHLLPLGTRQVTEFLAAHRVQRAEHDDLGMLLPFQDGLKSCTQGKGRLPGACPATEGDDAD